MNTKREEMARFIRGFLGQFQQMSSQFNHHAMLFRAKSNATAKGYSINFVLWLVITFKKHETPNWRKY